MKKKKKKKKLEIEKEKNEKIEKEITAESRMKWDIDQYYNHPPKFYKVGVRSNPLFKMYEKKILPEVRKIEEQEKEQTGKKRKQTSSSFSSSYSY